MPWKLPREWRLLRGSFTTSASEWRALLERATQTTPKPNGELPGDTRTDVKTKPERSVVRRSARKAFEWFRRAAEHGCAPAQNNFGLLLDEGKVVRRNRREALKLDEESVPWRRYLCSEQCRVMYRESGRMREAVRWFKKGVAAGDDDALIQLGIHYYWGKGARKNPAAAIRCFRKATKAKNISEGGRDDAFFYLGNCVSRRQGVKVSRPTAKRLLERANIDDDHPAARNALRQLR